MVQRLEVIPLGVDTTLFNMHDSRAITLSGSPVLLHVASLYPVKDQATLIRALPAVLKQFPDLDFGHFVIIVK